MNFMIIFGEFTNLYTVYEVYHHPCVVLLVISRIRPAILQSEACSCEGADLFEPGYSLSTGVAFY